MTGKINDFFNKSNRKEISATLKQLSEDTLVEGKQAFNKQIANSLLISDQIKSSIDNRSDEYIQFLSNGIERVNDLVENRYKNEDATGRTPKRRSTPVDPIQLPKTRPDDELLEVYRRRNQIESIDDFKTVSNYISLKTRLFVNFVM